MNARSVVSTLVLGALLLAQAPPAHAGRMLCRMKMPPRAESCSRCDAPKVSDAHGSLRAAGCCRIQPAPATEATPLVMAARGSSTDHLLPLSAPHAALLLSNPSTDRAAIWLPASGPPDSERLSRTTILRN